MRSETSLQLFAACFMQVVGKFGLLYIFPILPAITQEFFPGLSEAELGYKQGYLAGIFFLGNFFGNFFWVKIADKFGRKRAMILSTFLYSITVVMFGMSVSYSMALILRFLWGMFNGLDTIIKTFIAEICENRKDLSRGLAIMGLANGVGRMLGPTISAWLSKPTEKYKFLDFDILRMFPFLLPSLVCFLLAIVSISVVAVFVKETLVMRNKPGLETAIQYTGDLRSDIEYGNSCYKHRYISCIFRGYFINIYSLLSDRLILSALLNYNLFAFINIQFEELIPLMLVTAPCYGGFCMNENSLGLITLSASIVQIPWALWVVPVVIDKIGIRRSIRTMILIYSIILFSVSLWTRNPIVLNAFYSAITPVHNSSIPVYTGVGQDVVSSCISCGDVSLGITDIPLSVWLLLLPLLVPFFLMRMGLFTCYTVAVANASSREVRTAVNGLSQSGASLMRLIGPIFSANLFAWSISLGMRWPLDSSLIWSLGCLQLVFLLIASLYYRPAIEQPQD